MSQLRCVLPVCLVSAVVATPVLAQNYIYVVEADVVRTSGTDVVGIAGSHLQVVITLAPAQQTPIATTQAPTFYFTQYQVTSATYTFTGTAVGINDNTFAVTPTYWTYRNLHTDTLNDFIEISGLSMPMIGGTVVPAMQVHFPNQNTPPTTPAPLSSYTVGDVSNVIGFFRIGNFPNEVARYGFVNGLSYGGLDAVAVESMAWGAVKSTFR